MSNEIITTPNLSPMDPSSVESIPTNRREVDYQDDTNPHSVINLVPEKLRECILALPEEYLEMSWEDKKKKFKPTLTTLRLRMSFWVEFDNAVATGKQMVHRRIASGLITDRHWQRIIVNPEMLSCILTPPQDYMIAAHESLDAGLDKLREIFNANITDKDGTLNSKSAEVVLKAFALIDMRVKGAVIQKVQQQSVSLSKVEIEHSKTEQKESLPVDMGELEQKLQELRNLTKGVKPSQLYVPKNVVDIEVEYDKVEKRIPVIPSNYTGKGRLQMEEKARLDEKEKNKK